MIKYFVTYCVMDSQLGSNVFWHSCILLSQYREHEKIEVIDNWGFYGVPSTSQDGWPGFIKKLIGLNIDLNGNHGMLKHEDLRYLDVGYALHGVTFELTEIKFTELQERCRLVSTQQQQAIGEIASYLGLSIEPKHKIYPFETHSRVIFAIEKLKACQEKRPSRLQPFEINASVTPWGPSFHKSSNCKSIAISLLTGILTTAQIDRITENGKHPTIPRYSGHMEEIFFHSSGPLRTHTKSSGEIVYYRDFTDEGVNLHWTLPPQEIEPFSKETNDLFQIDLYYRDEVKQVIKKLQRTEWIFINAPLEDKYQQYRHNLIERIRMSYEAFSYPEPKKTFHTQQRSLFFRLFSLHKDKEEKILQEKLLASKVLLNELYMAMVDDWEIYDDYLPETAPFETEQVDEIETHYNPISALAAYLPKKHKKDLCKILNRTYIDLQLESPLSKLAKEGALRRAMTCRTEMDLSYHKDSSTVSTSQIATLIGQEKKSNEPQLSFD